MTKKDYEVIAQILKRNGCTVQVVIELADYFEKDNPKFKRNLFYRECDRPYLEEHDTM